MLGEERSDNWDARAVEDSTLPLLLLLQLVSDDKKIFSFQTRCKWDGSHVFKGTQGSLVLSFSHFIFAIFLWQRYSEDVWKTYPEVSCGRGRSCDKFDAFILLFTDLVSYYSCDFFVTTSISLYGRNGHRKKSLSHHHYITVSDTITVSITNVS